MPIVVAHPNFIRLDEAPILIITSVIFKFAHILLPWTYPQRLGYMFLGKSRYLR
jgi:hypothetical protein